MSAYVEWTKLFKDLPTFINLISRIKKMLEMHENDEIGVNEAYQSVDLILKCKDT